MSLQTLTESYREALAIRWRRLLILGLMDYFNNTNDFGKLIIKELLDMFEGLVKAFAECLGISLFRANGKWRGFQEIFDDVTTQVQTSSPELISKLQEIHTTLNSEEFNSLRKLRNDETHYLNLPDVPKETVVRVWRLFDKAVNTIDIEFFEHVKDRPEFEDFYFLHDFFKKVVLEGNRARIDLHKIKRKRESYPYININKTFRIAEVEVERSLWELIESIRKGEYA